MDVDSEVAVEELEKEMAESFNMLISFLRERYPGDFEKQFRLILLAERYYRNNGNYP
ncbi:MULTISPECIES: hypothetical protein [Endozoicomonas]|uniref:hypothetical protein n=1 Tax=Endozoicomonas TaxID=305899 RepID=UPI000A87C51F|nr:hypothetical protein [Endozoicomonas atrinae]